MSDRAGIDLIVGLGNPGPEYAETRHNTGFWLLDRIARSCGAEFQEQRHFFGHISRVRLAGRECWLLKPMAFMNHSGRSVAAFTHYYRMPAASVLVAYDELDLPPGTVRLKCGGGHGGHNGLRDILACLPDPGFIRLRVGVGHPGARELVTPFLLSRPSSADRHAIGSALDAALELLPSIVSGDLPAAMNRLHKRGDKLP